MMIKKTVILFIVISTLFCISNLYALDINKLDSHKAQIPQNHIADSLKWSVDYLNKLLYPSGEWYLTDHSYVKPIQSVLNYAENSPLDSATVDVRRLLNDSNVVYLIDRRPQDIRNVRDIRGYISDEEVGKEIEAIKKKVLDSLNISSILVPKMMLDNELSKVPRVPDGNPDIIWRIQQILLPKDFVTTINSRYASMLLSPNMSAAAVDSVRNRLFANYRIVYNDSVINTWRERVVFSYRSKYIADQSELRIKAYKKWVDAHNYSILTAYNDRVANSINDSLKMALQILTAHAEGDSSLIRLINLKEQKTEMWTANRSMKPIRMFLKNVQNDSLSVVLINNGKGELKLVIDDGIKLTRFNESQSRTVPLEVNAPDKKLHKVTLNKIVYPPWTLIGNGTVGFTQTSLSNWAKGGESALALLVISKYNANYSKDKTKWRTALRFGMA